MRSRNIIAAGAVSAAVLISLVFAQTIDTGTELALVERVVKARQELQSSLNELINYYHRVGDVTNASRAERELNAFRSIEQYPYARDTAGPVLEEPPRVLRHIPMADDYYTDGMIIAESRRKARKDLALRRFEKVLEEWPESDKAPLAAFEMGEIYSGTYFRDYDLAASYYKKAYDLNPAITLPALVRAGDMYMRLERYDDAVTMYKLAVRGSRDVQHKAQAERQLERLGVLGY